MGECDMLLSGFIPRRMVSYYKSFNYLDSFKRKINNLKNNPSKYVILLGTPLHSNMGDHLIAESEVQYLNDKLKLDVLDVPTEMYQIYRKELIKLIPLRTYVFITGGGWMGDVWPIEEKILENMAVDFKDNKTLIFPQTIFYCNPDEENDVSIRAKKQFEKCKNLVICTRDESSFEYAKKQYSNYSILCPDIALYHDRLNPRANSKIKIGICFRNDREFSAHITTGELEQSLSKKGFDIVKLSTIADKPVSCQERASKVNDLLGQFAQCDLVFTDRLHGMVYSYLARTSCIAFDNLTKKVSGVYDLWLKDCKYIKIIDSNCNCEIVLKIMLNMLDSNFKYENDNCISFHMIDEVLESWQK